ncbi:MbtH family protein [Dyella tabacisoli]|uniref:MbtH family protein n=1 Tax=Dyella tabacisoli TaxID=2282381 RepID=A0A369UQ17_9GAMM|nr:MbtH family NRPS accessory protein [Dyella tabacisoli]RDD80419.1 MbtH family protein [Dyella tabacisoli]
MALDETEDQRTYLVLINDEEQYSLWPKGRSIPEGWRAVDKEGSRAECSQYVDDVWTDMRPLSLRKQMQG